MPVCAFGVVLFFLLEASAMAGPAKGSGYNLPEIKYSLFNFKDLGLMTIEREKIAEQLASYVVNELGPRVIAGSDTKSIRLAEKILGLAFHLDPKNKTAVVADFQFKRGISPEKVEADYKPETLSALLYKRSELLFQQEGSSDKTLARYLLYIAVEMNPHNVDAVYDYEIMRRDGRAPDWNSLISGDGTKLTSPKLPPAIPENEE